MSTNGPQACNYAHLFRLLHWVLTGSAVILILTGISLHAAARPGWSVLSGVVPDWLWEGRVYVWHFWASVIFFPAMLGSLVFFFKSRVWLRSTQLTLVIGGLATTLTGVWMLYPIGSVNVLKTVVGFHAAFGLVVVPLALVWHIVLGLSKNVGLLVPSFRPFKNADWGQLLWFLPVVVLTTWIMFVGWPFQLSGRKLVASRVTIDRLDEALDMASLPWQKAEPLDVRLTNGSGFYSLGQTDLTLWALHNGHELFVKAQWNDPNEDYGYWPWMRRTDGWEYLQTNAKDETVHYEDKFSLVFPIEPSWHFDRVGCAIYCHVDGDYGWGYKGGQPDIDVWHWKSVRTDPAGQVDDKYWSNIDMENKDIGRFGDPKDGGGYTKNIADEMDHPTFLPDPPSAAYHGVIPANKTKEYSAEAAESYEPGAIVPGVISAAFEGDRGDVRCQSQHRDDTWTLYIRRKLDTGSPHDVKFVPGGNHPFGCAAFDRAAKRHAYSMPVFRLVLEEP